MDRTTYSDPKVAETINSEFIPVRVDIDHRPDISERYNRGGFPTTVFLSNRGESIWGATYVPPADMKRIMSAVLAARSSGEIDEALERGRMHYLDISKAVQRSPEIDDEALEGAFEDIFSSYDVDHGGFGSAPKFPNPDAVELMLWKSRLTKDEELDAAVRHTLDSIHRGLGDHVEGGIFRYSVTKDWLTPHYEKMLETNIGFLRNLVGAYAVLGDERFRSMAEEVARYLLDNLFDEKTGGFFGSQDADEEYYKRPVEARRLMRTPDIDRTVYAGWSCDASATMITAGAVLGDKRMVDAGRAAFSHAMDRLRSDEIGLVRHVEDSDLFLFDDQASFFESLLAMIELSEDPLIPNTIESLIAGAESAFRHEDGGYADVARREDAIGELGNPRRSLMANSRYAVCLARYSLASQKPELLEKASTVLNSFARRDIEDHGLFASAHLLARGILRREPRLVEVRSPAADPFAETLWMAAKAVNDPSHIVLFRHQRDRSAAKAAATICSPAGCRARIDGPEELKKALRE